MRIKALVFISGVFATVGLGFGQFNPVKNSSFEVADPANPNLAQYWQGSYTRAQIAGNWDGAYALQLAGGQSTVQTVVLNQSSSVPVRISARIKGANIVDDSNDKLGASLGCKVAYKDGTFSWCPGTLKTKNVGTFTEWRLEGFNTMNLANAGGVIDWIEVRLQMGNVAGTAWFDDVHIEEWQPTQTGMVTFRFDDSLLSTYTTARSVLAKYGFLGSEAAITSYLGVDPKHMNLTQLKELYASGWSVLSHTVTHPSLTTLSLGALNDELYQSHQFLINNGMNVMHFALPFGDYNALVITRAQAELYRSVASSDQDLNPQGVFPYNIYARPINSSTTVSDVQAWLNTARDRKEWLVLLVHEIDNPNGIYTTSSTTFRQIVDAVAASGLPVVTYDTGFSRMAIR